MELLYHQLAQDLIGQIENGIWRPGERLPGVRGLSHQRKLSVSTVLSAYRQMEALGFVESRERSGFYVRSRVTRPPAPATAPVSEKPTVVTGQAWMLNMMQGVQNPGVVQLGAAVPDISYLPASAVERALRQASRNAGAGLHSYIAPPGHEPLRRQIARHMVSMGCRLDPASVVITNGCQEALTLALRAVTSPGDVVAVESPTYYGLLQIIEFLGLRALEIPTHPAEGMSVDALALALENWPVKACAVIPSFNNPLGCRMPDAKRQALVSLLAKHGVPLIEDDVYGDLNHAGQRPDALKSLDKTDNVIYCSSFSKTLSPSLRLGWIVPGRYQSAVEYAKFVTTIGTAPLPQLATAQLLASDRLNRHLRQIRTRYAWAVERMLEACTRHFPEGTRMTQPAGGFVLWVELPEDVDTFSLAQASLQEGVSIAPGALFSARGRYQHCMRLSCALKPQYPVESAILTLAKLIDRQRR